MELSGGPYSRWRSEGSNLVRPVVTLSEEEKAICFKQKADRLEQKKTEMKKGGSL